ncbi:MAG: M15 family metallopeptidase [Fusobacteriaceae bacterium]
MTKHKFSKRSLGNIEGIDYRLVILLGLMLQHSEFDFIVTEGVRTKERQAQLVKEGKSKTMNSKHITGSAFDVAMLDEKGSVTWDLKYYKNFAETFAKLSKRLGFNTTWGGSWTTFVDGPHFQIND